MGLTHPALAVTYVCMTGVLFGLGDVSEARGYARRAYNVVVTTGAPDDPLIADLADRLLHLSTGE